jgi:hypothetical protein
MNILLRTRTDWRNDQGNEHRGERRSRTGTVRIGWVWAKEWRWSDALRRAQSTAEGLRHAAPLRRGWSAGFFVGGVALEPHARRHLKSSTRQMPHEAVRFSHISNRNWRASRSCRKQTIKPGLTETRTAQCRARFSMANARSYKRCPLATSHLLLTEGPLITPISNRELLVLEIPQIIENKRRSPFLIENFEPNSAPSFRAFVSAALLPKGTKGSRAAFLLIENLRKRFDEQEAG